MNWNHNGNSDDSSNDDDDDAGWNPKLPSDAPAQLKVLATNISEILDSIEAIRGLQYTQTLVHLYGMLQNLGHINQIQCDSHHTLEILVDQIGESEAILAKIKTTHSACHILADAMIKSITAIGLTFSQMPAYRGIDKDLITLMQRTQTDWHSHNHTK